MTQTATSGPPESDAAIARLSNLDRFLPVWGGSFAAAIELGFPHDRNTSIAFAATGNYFELAIAVAIGVFGVSSGQALAGAVGPLIEVPVLVGLVYVALWARRCYHPTDPAPISEGARR